MQEYLSYAFAYWTCTVSIMCYGCVTPISGAKLKMLIVASSQVEVGLVKLWHVVVLR
jgi:hypothetical protein